MTSHNTGPIEATRSVFRRALEVDGRSRRAEYWWFAALTMLAVIVADAVEGPHGIPVVHIGVSAVLVVPTFTVSVRRLHDTDRSAWGLLVTLIPLVGAFVLIFWLIAEGTPGPNRFGPSPKGLVAPDPVNAPPARPRRRQRRHLDAEGRLIGFEYVDEDGNVIPRD